MSYEDKLKELNIKLPEAKAPAGNYVATKFLVKCCLSLAKFQLMKMEI